MIDFIIIGILLYAIGVLAAMPYFKKRADLEDLRLTRSGWYYQPPQLSDAIFK